MAGTIPLAMTQQFDQNGDLLAGGRLYFFQAGTVGTPQNAYQDSGLTIALPNPIILDAAARIPQFFLADGQIKIRLTDKDGNDQLSADNILVIGPSSGEGGGGGQVDPTTVATTGDVKAVYGTGSIDGWVRMNGRTVGSATSGATERANADTQALFEYLWGVDANLTVSSGRGASAAADWSANKTITVPDMRGRILGALDDMGTTAAGRITSDGSGIAGTTLGAAGGEETTALDSADQLPSHTHTGTTSTDGKHAHKVHFRNAIFDITTGAGGPYAQSTAGSLDFDTSEDGDHDHTFTTDATGAGEAHNNMPPVMLVTVYIKL